MVASFLGVKVFISGEFSVLEICKTSIDSGWRYEIIVCRGACIAILLLSLAVYPRPVFLLSGLISVIIAAFAWYSIISLNESFWYFLTWHSYVLWLATSFRAGWVTIAYIKSQI